MKKAGIIVVIIALALITLAIPGYFIARHAFNSYFDTWGTKLASLDKQGLLSSEYGAAWKDILADDAMKNRAQSLTDAPSQNASHASSIVNGVVLADYPSLDVIKRLNEIRVYSNSIEIVDRNNRNIAFIRTNHTRARYEEFPPTLIKALIAAEDERFFSNKLGFEFDSYVRAIGRAVIDGVRTFSKPRPKGTSTITQQVAKLFISDIDTLNRRVVSRSLDRKLREMRLAAAMRKLYTPQEILEVYLNHCVTGDRGCIGFKDIARDLFGKKLSDLTDAECVYLSRIVKWGRQVPVKIIRQCRIDMPRMGAALGWDALHQKKVLEDIEQLSFVKSERVQTDYGPLVDLANEFFGRMLSKGGATAHQVSDMNLIDPNSLIRQKGNLRLQLTIDLGLQKSLQQMVDNRGYGRDTTIRTDVRVGSFGSDITLTHQPKDTLRRITICKNDTTLSEADNLRSTTLNSGDTLITNIRYQKLGSHQYHRSCFLYTRRSTHVDGQYYAYTIIDSRTGNLLAYYARDRIGSRLACLLNNRTPNGSSTAKPILNALCFDMGVFAPTDSWIDSITVTDDVPWKRTFYAEHNRNVGVLFEKSAVKGQPYRVQNHGGIFEGCQYVFDLLSTSNNILGVETAYRLNRKTFSFLGGIEPEGFKLAQFLQQTNSFTRVKDSLKLKYVTGIRAYKELCRIAGAPVDSVVAYGKKIPLPDDQYSIALGTLELSLYEQVHLFNLLYDNTLREQPAQHPSLVINQAILDGDTLTIQDTVRLYHPLSDWVNIRPTLLGLHKRLVSNPADGLDAYDIPTTVSMPLDTGFAHDAYYPDAPLANYAKSGTTDDVLRPFNADVTTTKRTNYGLWNAVIRVDLNKLNTGDSADIRDITIAAIGEGNTHYTGYRDGKTLHKFVSQQLLQRAGAPSPNGYFTQYEAYLKRVTPAATAHCGSGMQALEAGLEKKAILENAD